MSTIVLLSVLMLSVKPSVDLRDRFVDLSAFVPELLICRPSCRKCGGRPSCRPSSCRFWKPPHVEEVLPKFSTSLYNLDFYLFTHMQFIFFQRHSGRRRTMSEVAGVARRGIPNWSIAGIPVAVSRPPYSFLYIALVNLE
jgi:hypothetical protein